MADTTIADSYIITDAIFETYLTDDPRPSAIALKAASAATQGWYLKRATKAIDNLPLKGVTYYELTTDTPPGDGRQNRQFPRWIDGQCYGWENDDSLPEVPQEVLDACCEEAIAIYERINSQRLQNQREGVQSQSIAGSSVTYVPNAASRYHGLLSKDAYDLLKGFIAGAIELQFS